MKRGRETLMNVNHEGGGCEKKTEVQENRIFCCVPAGTVGNLLLFQASRLQKE